MRIDLHCHSLYSRDNYLDPEILVKRAIRVGLDGVCFTEHNSLAASRCVEDLKVPKGFQIFRGVEISTNLGHVLAYGLKDDEWNNSGSHYYLDFRVIVDRVHSLGGVCVSAHPFRGYDSLGREILRLDGLDAVETHNAMSTREQNRLAFDAAVARGLSSIGGSDCHRMDQVGRAFTLFSNPVFSTEMLVEEIRHGRCLGMMS